MSEIVNNELEKIEDIFKDIVWDNFVTVGITSFFAYFYFLNIPVIRQVIEFLLKQFSNYIFKYLKLGVDLSAIVFINESHKNSYTKAVISLKAICKNKGINSKEYHEAKQIAKIELSKFVSFNGT